MDDQVEFDINESLKLYLSDSSTIPTPEASSELLDCENDPDSLTSDLVNNALDPVIDAIAENPEALGRSVIFDTLLFLLKCALPPPCYHMECTQDPCTKSNLNLGNPPPFLLNVSAKYSI